MQVESQFLKKTPNFMVLNQGLVIFALQEKRELLGYPSLGFVATVIKALIGV